jgi:polyhydroxyalkanoate synthesis repressor PhaR
MLIKKYGNRRLYDTDDSRYITLDELTAKVRGGADVRVVDAKTDEDLTQATLAQIVIENRGAAKLLPAPLLTQLIRLGDDGLAEFFGRYVSGALDLYLQAKQGAQAVAPYNPLAGLMGLAVNPFARMFGTGQGWSDSQPQVRPSEVDALRREVEAMRASLRKRKKKG